MRKIPLFHKGMTVFFNFFKKSATKRLLAYRYGARKGNLTFFENRSLNRGFHSLYGVKVEKFFKITPQIRYYWTVLCKKKKKVLKKCRKITLSGQCSLKRGKTIVHLYSNTLFVSSVGAIMKKLYVISCFCILTGISR